MVDRAAIAGSTAMGLSIVVALGLAVATVTLGVLPTAPGLTAATLAVDGDRIVLTHRAGDAVGVRRLDVVVRVGGESLAHQPPVPFFSARGFRPGPTGPFNAAADPIWDPGERASIRVASTNRPSLRAGANVTVELRYDGRRLLVLSATA
ncbi:type IV pilin [Haloplanus halobius]|uniref:type IV pilin n=1 Tax=Haloplanus halobius TaxID=2934938 RepID=UPI00200BB0C1|nr:type IV pilin [Haloplanus sp. XH21]